MHYYFFTATLPSFFWGDKPPLGVGDYLQQCEQHLSPADFSIMESLLKDEEKKHGNSIADSWVEFNRCLHNEFVVLRTKKYGLDLNKYLHGERDVDMHIIDIVELALEEDNPLLAENVIDHAKWVLLDEMVQGHFFDIDFLLVYGLKLKIAERQARISEEGAGSRKFEEIKGSITGKT